MPDRIPRGEILKHLKKKGYLSLTCQKCGIAFTCSGHCVKSSIRSYFSSEGVCLCEKCDRAKTNSSDWYSRCQKIFPENWIRIVGEPKWYKRKQRKRKIENV